MSVSGYVQFGHAECLIQHGVDSARKTGLLRRVDKGAIALVAIEGAGDARIILWRAIGFIPLVKTGNIRLGRPRYIVAHE